MAYGHPPPLNGLIIVYQKYVPVSIAVFSFLSQERPMRKIDITRAELVWPGKYDDEGKSVPLART